MTHQQIRNNLYYLSLLLLVITIPIKISILPTVLSVWIGFWLIEGSLKSKFFAFNYRSKYYVPMLLYFLLTVISCVRAGNSHDAWFQIQHKLSLAFFPIIIAGSNEKVKKNINTILSVFVISVLLVSLFLILHALFTNMVIENGHWYVRHWHWDGFENYTFFDLVNKRLSNFSGSYLSFLMHRSYLSMYILFAIVVLIDFMRKDIISKKAHKFYAGVVIAFFVIMIYLLQSRAGLLAFVIATIFAIILEIRRKKKKKYIFTGVVVLIIGASFIVKSDSMQKAVSDIVRFAKQPTLNELEQNNIRLQTNYAAIQIIKEKPLFGIGPANMRKEMANRYKQYGFITAEKQRLDAHNQYLETFAGLGITGFFVLMSILFLGFYKACKTGHYLLFFLLLILMVNFFFESMLNSIGGIIFMILFYSLFIFLDLSNNSEREKCKAL